MTEQIGGALLVIAIGTAIIWWGVVRLREVVNVGPFEIPFSRVSAGRMNEGNDFRRLLAWLRILAGAGLIVSAIADLAGAW